MRSRPDITLFLSPRRPVPGQQLVARVRLNVRSETPCDGLIVRLLGNERRYRNTSSSGKTTVTHYHRREVVSQGLMIKPGTLRPGVIEQEFRFEVPHDAPPSYRSSLSLIDYKVDVRVDIPWWPDAHEVYAVEVDPPSRAGVRGHPRAVTNVQGERRGEGIAMELSLAEDASEPGGTVRGALALTGLAAKSLRRVELACVAVESARVYSAAGPTAVDRRVWVLREGTPAEGEAIPFSLGLPPELTSAFASPFIEVTHHLEATAVVAWGRDVSVHVPLLVAAGAGQSSGQVPAVGRARNLAVWQQAVSQVSIPGASLVRFEPESAQVVFSVHGLRVVAREETRGDGPCLVAEVSYPALGADLRVAERTWTDLGAKLAALDPEFQRRFTVRAREQEQAAAVLDDALRAALGSFDEAAMDDRGAVVSRTGGVFQLSGLERFLHAVQVLAANLAAACARVPPPSALASCAEAYRDFARERGATLRRGDLTLHDWSVKGVVLHTAHRWTGRELNSSAIEVTLPDGADESRWRESVVKELGERASVSQGAARVEVDAMRDPAAALPRAEALAELTLRLMRGEAASPYRR